MFNPLNKSINLQGTVGQLCLTRPRDLTGMRYFNCLNSKFNMTGTCES